ncbi:DUF2935 domain-containing protein [Desulfotruncus alcoholivorax]|uniref:DUF2935 domain-containing protein n=1 Tax=Desulfotruncus alcoholivorax TaxID=265477 RepID=UPI000405B59A|nr:DUF2935 domain-containing protein [Desulfotruncus alcoholivorax]
MNRQSFDGSVLFEHRFWLQILGDHARFIYNSLSPKEVETIKTAQEFISIFDQLSAEARKYLFSAQLDILTQQACNQAKKLRAFKLGIINRQLTGNIQIHLAPTFVNHMVNELEEYLRVIDHLEKQELPIFSPVHLHLLWLLDAIGHASYITSSLDEVEKQLTRISIDFSKVFDDLYSKAVEMAGLFRTGLNQFPALSFFNSQAEHQIKYFSDFLNELQQLILSKKASSILTPLVTDHMLREECYYLMKLAMVSEIKNPTCDPTKPRIDDD